MNTNDLLKKIQLLENTISSQNVLIEELKEENQIYLKIIFARRSEKRNFNATAKEQSLLFNEAEEIIYKEKQSPGLFSQKDRQKPGGRNPLPVEIPRDEHILALPDNKLNCRHCNNKLVKIGESVTEKLDIIPQKVLVRKIVRPKYICKCCETEPVEIIKEPLPKMLLPKAVPDAGFIAYAVSGKYADRMPFYHFAKVLGRAGLDISRWDLSRWSIDVFDKHLKSPLENFRKKLFTTDYLQIDETTLQVLGQSGKNYMWAVHGNLNDKKIAYFHYKPSRSAGFLKDWLKNFKGVIQTDGFKSYKTHLQSLPNVIHAGCNVHARRKFVESSESPEQEMILDEFSKLYKIESDLANANAPPETILAVRKEKTLPILKGIRDTLNKLALKFRPSGNFGKATRYFLNEYERLTVFCDYPHLRPDTNLVENDIRPFALGRKNWLFSGSQAGAAASAGYYTLVQIANLNQWDPYYFLHDLFTEIEKTESEIDLAKFIGEYSPAVA